MDHVRWCTGVFTLALVVGLTGCSSAPVATATPTVNGLQARPLHLARLTTGPCQPTPGQAADQFSPFGTGFTPGDGPVYPILGEQTVGAGETRKVLWIASPRYQGPILVRGRQLDGDGTVRFGDSAAADAALELGSSSAADGSGNASGGASGSAGGGDGWRSWPKYTFVTAPGCYAYQVDGAGFTETIVFRATAGPLGGPGCQPPSPTYIGSAGPEVEGTSSPADLWALLFDTPPLSANQGVKIVWRMTGAGQLHLDTTGPGGIRAVTGGPEVHLGSTWTRPGDEWGSGFLFPTPGCWDIHAVRDGAAGDVWLAVH